MADDGSRARAIKNAPGPLDALRALVDFATSGLRGSAKVSLGWPGDLERLLGEQVPDMYRVFDPHASAEWNLRSLAESLERTKHAPTLFPTSHDVDRWLPPATTLAVPPEQNPFEKLGEWAPLSAGQVGRAALSGARLAGRMGAEAVRRGVVEGRGPLAAVSLAAQPAYAVRPRGGNFDPSSLKEFTTTHELWEPVGEVGAASGREAAINQWTNKQLKNYLAKDLGSPADPLLAVERDLPNLHLPPDTLPTPGALATARARQARYNEMRSQGNDPWAPSLERPWPINDAHSVAGKQLNEHDRLTGGAALTPWTYLGDRSIESLSPAEYQTKLLGERWGAPPTPASAARLADAVLSNAKGPIAHWPSNLERTAYEYLKGDPQRVRELEHQHPDLLAALREAESSHIPPWVKQAPPDTKIWQLADRGDGNYPGTQLGFGHVRDYLDAATSAHEGMDGVPMDKLREWAQDPAYATIRQQLALHDAGLALDPQSLGRLSVADAVRKTAAWNEHLAQAQEANPALQQGIKRVHKEYPDQGLRWVELGIPSETGKDYPLPGGFSIVPASRQPGKFTIRIPSGGSWETTANEVFNSETEAQKAWNLVQQKNELRNALSAEGEAMGHCVGGYCDQVLRRGTKIYSLRDAKGQPHVTVETRPVDDKYINRNRVGDPQEPSILRSFQLPEDVKARLTTELGIAEPKRGEDPSITNSLAIPWLEQNYPDVHQNIMNQTAWRNWKKFMSAQERGAVEDIIQIKGKQNAAPVNKYLPMVQDFVKSGNWGKVGDLRNTGLRAATDVFGPTERAKLQALGKEPTGYLTQAEIDDLQRNFGATPEDGGNAYAAGGSVIASDDLTDSVEPLFLQRFAGGGTVRALLEKMEALAPELGKAGALTRKAARAAESRGGASFEQLVNENPAAVRARGGNFNDLNLGSYLGNEQLGVSSKYDPPWGTYIVDNGERTRQPGTASWAETQLANYLRKDLGSPADPLLAVERDLPNLHLPPGALNAARDRVAELPRLAAWGLSPSGLKRLQTHQRLTNPGIPLPEARHLPNGGWGITPTTPLTPWGYHSDEALSHTDPAQLLKDDVSTALDFSTYSKEGPPKTPSEALAISPTENAWAKRYQWLETAPPDTEIWGLKNRDDDPLGFAHVLDYLDAAQKSHGVVTEAKPGVLDWARQNRGQIEPTRLSAIDLHDAGLSLDPRSLGRLSVADAVRKTAAWNDHLANSGLSANPDLARGIARVHKEYPEGMRWVELGNPAEHPTELPSDFELKQLEDGGVWAVLDKGGNYSRLGNRGASTPEDALKSFWGSYHKNDLEAGLNAEGNEMGHCVGSYCDDVAERGTKIFSLRDRQNNPHVTVEVRRNEPNLRAALTPAMRRQADQVFNEWVKLRDGFTPAEAQQAYLDWVRENQPKIFQEFMAAKPTDDIIQIKGKQNAAPVEKYLPFVQDFVKSGNWGRVGDLGNTGLYDVTNQSTAATSMFTAHPNLPKQQRTLLWSAFKDANPDVKFATQKDVLDWAIKNPDAHPVDLTGLKPPDEPGFKGGGVVQSRFEAALARRG